MSDDEAKITEAMARTLSRLADAKGIHESVVTHDHFQVKFTELGFRQLAQLDLLLREAGWPVTLED